MRKSGKARQVQMNMPNCRLAQTAKIIVQRSNASMRSRVWSLALSTIAPLLVSCQDRANIRQECENSVAEWQRGIAGEIPDARSTAAMSELAEGAIERCINAGGWENSIEKMSAELASVSPDGSTIPPSVINDLKSGHMRTCVPNISGQLESVTGSSNLHAAELYCACVGNFYFNDLSAADVQQIARGSIPQKIAAQRSEVQNYCSDLHLAN